MEDSNEAKALLGDAKLATRGTDLSQTTFIMINCFIGAGILTVPFAFRLAGYGAVLALGLVAAMNWFTSLLLGKALDKAAKLRPDIPRAEWDLPTLGRVAFGPMGQHCIGALFALELWFAMETFLVLTGINVSLVAGVPKTPVIVFSGLLGTLCLSLPPSVIASFSFLSVWCMAGGLLALVVCGTRSLSSQGAAAQQHLLLEPSAFPSATGLFLYCFSGLPCLPHIRASMKRPEEYPAAVHMSFVFAAAYYAMVGLLGYHFYAGATRESFTENLAPSALAPSEHSLRCGFALLSVPVYAAPVLQALGSASPPGQPAPVRTLLVRSAFAVVSVTAAVMAQDALDAVAEIMGAFLTNATSLIFPCAAYASVCWAGGERLGALRGTGIAAVLAFGAVFSAVGTVSACR
eukprot:CAMPEP_0171165544 /NCGR_PEP_ID=MMETSP0790-20130122/6240_1 /TAXON_ID=2925 /ORGANISM="Alexandrium catenella, Strain OF101" /LENGTH=404 /DNA_ID=CAMNT_0011630337 /DNA_START=117 /DNA_END=1327 /DNA_ORIENTATION=-